MADTQSTIALNIGSQRISMAVFEPSKSGGLVLKSYDSEVILADPATEPSRSSQVANALNSLAQRMKVKNSKVRYAVSGQAVFTRFVKLPPLDADNIEQLVTFEAQQHVPNLEEAVWDYEVLEGGDGEKEVVIVAIKGEALEDLNDSVNSAGMSTAEVDVAPMALYNAYRASNPQSSDPVLLIDIGAKSTDLLYIEGKRFFTRSINRAGVMVSAAIAKEYGVSFADAESHKTQGGMVALGGGHTTEMDETTAALAMTIRNALSQLPAEIARTTNHYRSQFGGNAPKSVILAGGGANLPYTKEFFEEKLHLPVQFFNPLGVVSMGKNVDVDKVSREAHLMGELVGLGLRGVGKSAINIDLVPGKVQASRDASKRKPFLIGAAVAFLAGIGIWAAMTAAAASKAEAAQKDQANVQESLSGPEADLKALVSKQEKLNAVAKDYTTAEASRTFWVDSLSELKAAFASDSIWITDMEPIVGYNAFAPKTVKVMTAVKADISGLQYGVSAIDSNVRSDAPAAAAGGKTPPPAANATAGPVMANAILIRGFWRENPGHQNIVYDSLKRLMEKPEHFRFEESRPGNPAAKPPVPNGKPETIPVDLIIREMGAKLDPGTFGAPFEMILPLAHEVQVK